MRAAASSSAPRTSRGSSSSARRAAASGTSSSATEAGLQRSKRAVYSSSAPSPRSRTSSRIAAVARSTPPSCAPSNASRRSSSRSKPAASEERRRGSTTARPREGIDERRERLALELERGRVHDQPAGNGEDLLDRREPVRLERAARVHQVHDRVGEADQRRELHRAVELDEVDVHALGGEVLARGLDVFRRDAQARALLHGGGVVEAFG